MPVIVPFGGVEPRIDPSAWAAPSATLVGDVQLGPGASVFYGAVIRADRDAIVIGAGSNIQDNVTLHTDAGLALTIGSGVSVGHGAVIHGCAIGDDCLIGMGAIVMNGVVIGAGSLVAAGALVLERTVIPPGSLVVGSPARVARALTPEEQRGVVANAAGYAELAQEYRASTD